jgi:hypothetical protein
LLCTQFLCVAGITVHTVFVAPRCCVAMRDTCLMRLQYTLCCVRDVSCFIDCSRVHNFIVSCQWCHWLCFFQK